MSVENGEWTIRGVSADDPRCLHTVEDLENLIEEIGFLPLFAGKIPGFSVEERTEAFGWWSGDPAIDPWEWRAIIAGRGQIAYGKFFDKKAGFISRKWLPVFTNYRRNGYDFDARWDDELASYRQKRIMDLFLEEKAENELLSNELKEQAGFGKGGEKNFDGTLTDLQMRTYLVCRDFRQRTNKKGVQYGWAIAVLSSPEHVFGRELVTRNYSEDPEVSLGKIIAHMKELFPSATDKEILKVVGIKGK